LRAGRTGIGVGFAEPQVDPGDGRGAAGAAGGKERDQCVFNDAGAFVVCVQSSSWGAVSHTLATRVINVPFSRTRIEVGSRILFAPSEILIG